MLNDYPINWTLLYCDVTRVQPQRPQDFPDVGERRQERIRSNCSLIGGYPDYTAFAEKRDCFAKHQPGVAAMAVCSRAETFSQLSAIAFAQPCMYLYYLQLEKQNR